MQKQITLIIAALSFMTLVQAGAETPAQFAALQAQVASLQKQVSTLMANKALLLGPFVNVDYGMENGVTGPHITFTGVNIHIVSGSGFTNDEGACRGLGNLIIGYDESPANTLLQNPFLGSATQDTLNPGDRSGSHNLIVGRWHKWLHQSFGGFLAGEENTITSIADSVAGGGFNSATAEGATLLGGYGQSSTVAFGVQP